MLKRFFVLVLFLIPQVSIAQGILQVKYSLLNTSDRNYFSSNPDIGLWVNEPIKYGFEYQSWSGFNRGQYFITEHYALFSLFGKIKLGLGPSYGTGFEDRPTNNLSLKAMLEVKLW